ncbi:hypothetical protein [Sphaerisporangium sp. TRM90804]|uniref:hypothetical protein n=1 Tax=Sphaerisporangium sp. TRM90804 TaxID=3031113 RepID=UPI0024467F71|nr:hypothetical protein [Sphaerisporangium sp. TRM90804]MDH2424649.1 hypothetical protein [Sphaerisporangium sp. TRM90804]
MEALTIAILSTMLFAGVVIARWSRLGHVAMAPVEGEFRLSPQRAASIAARSGLTVRERMSGRTVPVLPTATGARVDLVCRAGLMSFEFTAGPEGSACRVVARAGEVAAFGLPRVGGLAASSTNVLYLKMSVPRNPARLLRRRDRALRAMARAAGEDSRLLEPVDAGHA